MRKITTGLKTDRQPTSVEVRLEKQRFWLRYFDIYHAAVLIGRIKGFAHTFVRPSAFRLSRTAPNSKTKGHRKGSSRCVHFFQMANFRVKGRLELHKFKRTAAYFVSTGSTHSSR